MHQNNILLISPRLDNRTARNVDAGLQENLGLGYLASYLEQRGIISEILDMNKESGSLEKLIEYIKDNSPRMIGISIHSKSDMVQSGEISNSLKENHIQVPIVCGGHYASRNDREVLDFSPGIDFVVRGDGEESLYELFSCINDPMKVKNISGISYKDGKKIIQNAPRELQTDLDLMPFPKRYAISDLLKFKKGAAHMLTSRGCPGGCSFCVSPLSKRWRMRGVQNVVDEISYLHSLGIRNIVFEDDNYLGTIEGKRRAKKIADEVKLRGLDISYEVSARIDNLDSQILMELVSSGVSKIRVGVESFNKRQLDLYNKRTEPEIIIQKMREIIDSGAEPHFSFITFDPYVTLDELQITLDNMALFSKYIHFRYVSSLLIPLEGSRIWNQLGGQGLLGEEKGTFKFVNESSQKVWEFIGGFKNYFSEIENRSRDLNRYFNTAKVETPDFIYNDLKDVNRSIETRITNLWIDSLQFSLDSVKSGLSYSPNRKPPLNLMRKRGLIERQLDYAEDKFY